MKRRLLSVLAIVLAAAFVFAACQTNQPGSGEPRERLDSWLFDETFNFRVVQAGRAHLYDDDNLIEQTIAERLNVQIEYIRIPEATYEEQVGILLASRDLPDIVYFGSFAGAGFNAWKQQGAIIALDDLLESNGQDIVSRWRDDDWSRVRSDVDGRIYGIPAITDLLEAFSVSLRMDWLENLGLDVPVTLDEWVTVLEAVRDGDPRGDGSGGAIPYAGLLRAWENAFGIQSTPWQVYGDQYLSRFEHPHYIEYVEFMRDMYDKRLIDPEYFTRNTVTANIEALFFGDMAFATEQWAAFTRTVTDVAREVNPEARMVGVDPIVGPHGHQQIIGRARWMSVGAITAMAQRPADLMTFLNYFFTEDGIILTNFGVEGVTFEFVNGEPRLIPEFATFEASRRVGINKTTEAIIMTTEYFQQCQLMGVTLEEAEEGFQIFYEAMFRNTPFIYIPAIQFTSPNFAANWPNINQILTDSEVQAIIGNITVEQHISNINDQKRAGLDTITQELNDVFQRTR